MRPGSEAGRRERLPSPAGLRVGPAAAAVTRDGLGKEDGNDGARGQNRFHIPQSCLDFLYFIFPSQWTFGIIL